MDYFATRTEPNKYKFYKFFSVIQIRSHAHYPPWNGRTWKWMVTWLEDDPFSFGAFRPIFRGKLAVSFRKGRSCNSPPVIPTMSLCFSRRPVLGVPKSKVTPTQNPFPDAPCMDYLPTLGEKWPQSRGNIGKYSLHGAFGFGMTGFWKTLWVKQREFE